MASEADHPLDGLVNEDPSGPIPTTPEYQVGPTRLRRPDSGQGPSGSMGPWSLT